MWSQLWSDPRDGYGGLEALGCSVLLPLGQEVWPFVPLWQSVISWELPGEGAGGALTSQVRQIHQMRAVLWRRWETVSGQQLTLPTALRVGVLAQYWGSGWGTNSIYHWRPFC